VVDREGQSVAERRTITIGANFGGQAVIQEGLAVGEHVVVVGQSNLADGEFVAVEATYESALDYATRGQAQ
jgi:membrane fusion protein, multidrug efflux system